MVDFGVEFGDVRVVRAFTCVFVLLMRADARVRVGGVASGVSACAGVVVAIVSF